MMIRAFANYQKIFDIPTTVENDESPNGFDGQGVSFKVKLIGMEQLSLDRDENECLEALNRLKASVRVRGEHKQKVQMNIGVNGIQVIDESTKIELVCHEIRQVTYVIMDPRDPRAFGYVYNTTDGRHQFWGIKTERFAQTVVFALKDLFDEIYKIDENPDETRTQEEHKSVSNDQVTVVLQHATSDFDSAFDPQPSKSASQTTPMISTPLFDDTWGGNLSATMPQPFQTPEQQSAFNTDPWGFSEPVIPIEQPAPRVESPVNLFTLPPPPSSRRSTITQSLTPIAGATDLFSLFPAAPPTTPANDNALIEPIQPTYFLNSIPASSMTSPSATNLFDESDMFGGFSSESTTVKTVDDFFFSTTPFQ